MKSDDVEFKNILNQIINTFMKIFDVNTFLNEASKELRQNYQKGIDKAEEQFDQNFFIEDDRLNFLQNYTFDNIKDMTADAAEDLRKQLSMGLMNYESIDQLKERVKKVMDVTENRARTIARTEVARAENMGHIDGARQSGLPMLKEWIGYKDAKTSDVCRALNGVRIPIDDKFKWTDKKGVLHEYDAPPAHPNCRSTLKFVVDVKD